MLLFFDFIPPMLFLAMYLGGLIMLITGMSLGRVLLEKDYSGQLKIPNLSNTHKSAGNFSSIAFMMRGISGVSEVLLLGLIQKNYLRRNINDDSILEQVPNHPPIEALNQHELKIFDCFTHPLSIRQAFDMWILKNAIQDASTHYEKELIDAGLIISEKTNKAFETLSIFSFVLLLGIGLVRLTWASLAGFTNVGLLVLLLLLSVPAFRITSKFTFKRITKKGKKYLKTLRETFSPLQPKIREEYANAQMQGIPSEYLALVSVFGLNVLSDSPEYKHFSDNNQGSINNSSYSGFGCGGVGGGDAGGGLGCGGSGCGGGGCGGGCGGG